MTRFITLMGLILPVISQAIAAYKVIGKPEGFAAGTTGGGSATPLIPANIAQLRNWLDDDVARVIVLDKEYNFIGSQGKVTENGCRPASNTCVGKGGQDAINGANWCTQSKLPVVKVTYDKVGVSNLWVKSNKSLVGVGNKGVIRGTGLRIANGVKNVIIQNIKITDLNPQYIWGGDAIAIAGADRIWIDHCTFSLIGRQMLVLGSASSGSVTISNNDFDGTTSWSVSCDDHHYWAITLSGTADLITFKGNYIHSTSGRSPRVDGGTTLHAVNNYWSDNTGHAFDVSAGQVIVAEGNTFQNIKTCSVSLGRACQANVYQSSGALSGSAVSALAKFKGPIVAAASVANSAAVRNNAGVGKL